MLIQETEDLNRVSEPELITLPNGDQIYILVLNTPSNEARNNLNKVYNELKKMGKI